MNERLSGLDLTFTIHPRPRSDDPKPLVDAAAATGCPEQGLAGPAPVDLARHRDTFFGDLVFLARFAFGRY